MVTLRNASVLLSSLTLLISAGCAEKHRAIPASARLVAEDRAGKIDFVAPDLGEVFVEDNTSNKLLYSGKMTQGERLTVNPQKDQLTINGQVVRDQKIRDLNELRVFFRADPRAADVAGSRTTVNQPIHVHPAQPQQQQPQQQQPARSGDTEIRVAPSGDRDGEIRVRPGDSNSRVTVEPGEEGSKVIVEPR